jgi:serine/threonine protein kinase
MTEAGRHADHDDLETLVERFEKAWRRGQRPNIDDYLPVDKANRLAVLDELAHVELEFRLKAGEPACVEDYLRRYLVLGTNRTAILSLIAVERDMRRRLKPEPTLEEYTGRFPDFRKELLLLFRSSSGGRVPEEHQYPRSPANKLSDLSVAHVPASATSGGARCATPLQAAAPSAAALLPRAKLGGYSLVRQIGSGGMGTVFEAIQEGLDRRVAVKVLRNSALIGPTAVPRFRREAKAMARLRHPSIIPIYEVAEQDQIHYYTMQLVEGVPLSRVIHALREGTLGDKDPFDPDSYPSHQTQHNAGETDTSSLDDRSSEDARLASGRPVSLPSDPALVPISSDSLPQAPRREDMRDAGSSAVSAPRSTPTTKQSFVDAAVESIARIADALHQVHLHGTIHRDVKPGNLFLAGRRRLLLMDFGLAHQEGRSTLTLAGDVIGTPMYMSPEQATAGRSPVDHRTDIYSLGVTLYELLTLTAPYETGNVYDLLHQVLVKKPRTFKELNLPLAQELEAIVFKAMAKNPDQRHQTAKELAEDLRRYLDRTPSLEQKTPPVQKTVSQVQCIRCGVPLASSARLPVGQLVQCLKCNTVFRVPGPTSTPTEPRPASVVEAVDHAVLAEAEEESRRPKKAHENSGSKEHKLAPSADNAQDPAKSPAQRRKRSLCSTSLRLSMVQYA